MFIKSVFRVRIIFSHSPGIELIHFNENTYELTKKNFCFSVYLVLSLVMVSLTGIAFYDIPQLNIGEHLSEHRDIYLSNSQLVNSEAEKSDEKEEKSSKK